MAKKKPLESLKEGEEIKSLTKEELQKLRVKLSIEVPKEAFDELLKAMMGMDDEQKNSATE
ncbi:MAG: hypothetical protein HDR89_02160 [Bacteroides sp.]|nr:hypothetical protein [Bacteroides sp.]